MALAHPTEAATAFNVIILDFAFTPQNLTIDSGDTVTWQNNDLLIYTLWFTRMSDSSNYLLSPPILPGESWSCTFNETVSLQYFSLERLWITGFINPSQSPPPSLVEGLVGMTGYKLVFKETMNNPYSSPATIDYYWSFSIDKWNGAAWVASGISGSSTPVAGYTIPPLSTVDLPYYVYLLPMSGPNAVAWGNWLRISYTFHWTYNAISYATDYSTKLHVHPGDIAGTAMTFPYIGADGKCDISDAAPLGSNWQKTVPPGTNPTIMLARSDITGNGKVDVSDAAIIGANWGKKWTNTPPPG